MTASFTIPVYCWRHLEGRLSGHQDAFLWPRLSARYPFSEGTLAGDAGQRARRALPGAGTGRAP